MAKHQHPIQTPDYWAQASTELSARDPAMARLIRAYPDSMLNSRGAPFYTLVRSVVGQQISVKAADSIWTRLLALCPPMTPKTMLACSVEQLRMVGLSERKAQYVHHIAEFFAARRAGVAYWARRDDETIITELTTIRGVGRWTAEIFLIFTLMRPNVFPVDDLGLLRGLEVTYPHRHHNGRLTSKMAKEQFFDEFSPWATVATWYLWRSLDPMEVQY